MRAIKPSGHHSQNSLVVKIIYIHWAKNRHDCIWKIKEPRARFFEEQYTRCFDNTSSSFYSSFKWHWHNRTFFKKRMCLFQQLTFNIYFGNLSNVIITVYVMSANIVNVLWNNLPLYNVFFVNVKPIFWLFIMIIKIL